MNYKSKQHLILQNLFELRKIHSITERLSSGRIFFLEDKMGLCDASGAIWPIGVSEHLNSTTLKHGDLISFRCKIYRNNDKLESKYDDSYFIKVTEIIQKNSCLAEWNNLVIPNPIPSPNFIESQQTYLQKKVDTSQFYNSPSKTRLKFVKIIFLKIADF